MLTTIEQEWHDICHDAWLKVMLFWVPFVLGFIIWAIFSVGIARDLPIGVIDHDNSSISRALIRNYDASPSLAVVKHFISMESASTALKEGSIYALVIMPYELEKKTTLGKAPQVTALYNSQFILIGKLIKSGLISAHGTYVAKIETFKDLVNNQGNIDLAIGDARPISSQITPLFNANMHYGQFLVSAIIPAIWQIIIMLSTILYWAKSLRKSRLDEWITHLDFNQQLFKLIPYVIIFWLQGIVYLAVFHGTLHWPMHGSWSSLIIAQLFLVIAAVSVASLILFITLDATRAMSLVAAFSAPAFAFMGVTFPTTDMPFIAQIWRALLPVSHYINIQIQQANYGADLSISYNSFVALVFFILALFLSKILWLKRKRSVALSEAQIDVPHNIHNKGR